MSFYDSTIKIFNVQFFDLRIGETGHHQSLVSGIDKFG